MRIKSSTMLLLAATAITATPAAAQDTLDRTAPSVAEPERDAPPIDTPSPAPRPSIEVEVPRTPTTGTRPVQVGAVAIAGLDRMRPADFADIVAAHVGRTLTQAQLRTLADRVAGRARSYGLVFASAVIEPQRMTAGVLTVRLDEGRIDRIRVAGDASPAVEQALAPLVTDRAPLLDEVERRLLLAGDLPGVRVRRSRFLREDGAGVLVVDVAADPVSGRLVLENDGSRAIGPEQLRADFDVAGLLTSGDSVSLTYVTTPFEPSELQYGRFRYGMRIDDSGTELGLVAQASGTEPGAYLSDREISGRSTTLGATLLQPLWRRRAAGLWFEGEASMRTLRQSRSDRLVRRDRIAALRAGLSGIAEAAGGRLRINATLTRGLDVLNATAPSDPLASRDDADGAFTTAYVWTDWIRDLGGDVSMRLVARGQVASEPLLLSEELGLGGPGFLRGYDYNERSGDEGAMGSVELRYDIARPLGLARRAQFYAFIDGGQVTNLGPDGNSGSLASGGGGVRSLIARGLNLGLELAVPMSGERYDSGNSDPQVNFRIARSF